MITMEQYIDFSRDWKLGLVNPATAGTSSALTWYDHVCPIYSMKMFSDIKTIFPTEMQEKMSEILQLPKNELEASIIMRKVFFLLLLFKKKIPVRNISIIERIYPEFPKIPYLHGIIFELYSGLKSWSDTKISILSLSSFCYQQSDNDDDIVFDSFSPPTLLPMPPPLLPPPISLFYFDHSAFFEIAI